jgi:hypothetical protein
MWHFVLIQSLCQRRELFAQESLVARLFAAVKFFLEAAYASQAGQGTNIAWLRKVLLLLLQILQRLIYHSIV